MTNSAEILTGERLKIAMEHTKKCLRFLAEDHAEPDFVQNALNEPAEVIDYFARALKSDHALLERAVSKTGGAVVSASESVGERQPIAKDGR